MVFLFIYVIKIRALGNRLVNMCDCKKAKYKCCLC